MLGRKAPIAIMCPVIDADATATCHGTYLLKRKQVDVVRDLPSISAHETGCCQKPARVRSRIGNLCGPCHRLFLSSPPCFGQLVVPARKPAPHRLCVCVHLAYSWPGHFSGCSNHSFVPAAATPLEVSHVFSNLQLAHRSALSGRRWLCHRNFGRLFWRRRKFHCRSGASPAGSGLELRGWNGPGAHCWQVDRRSEKTSHAG